MTPSIFGKSLKDIEQLINTHLMIKQDKKVESGEVFTPFFLIVEMLSTLPKSVWENPTLKWLDPGSGIGNFSMLVFYNLDEGLKSWESDDTKRRKHIIQNMLYMVELTKENVEISNTIFGGNANICCADYLLEENIWKEQFNMNTYFDVILGNPPYNKNGMRGKGRSNPGLQVIWNKFVHKSLGYMNKNGYSLFFTPNSWTELKSGLSKEILKNQIILMKNFDVVKAYKLFKKKAGSLPICYYLLQNKEPKDTTKLYDNLIDEYVDFDINKYLFIPNKNIHLVKKLLNHSKDNLENYFYFTPAKVKKDDNTFFKSYSTSHPFPLINYVHKKIYITYSKHYSRLQNGRPKLLLPNYSMGYPVLDIDGIIDVGGRSSYVLFVDDDDVDKLKKIRDFFLTDLALTLINSLKTAQKFLSTRTFSLFPDVTKMNIPINDDSLEKYFKLTSKEKLAIDYQRNHGEGNFKSNMKNDLLHFSMTNYLQKSKIDFIKERIRSAKKKDKKTFRTLKRRVRNQRNKASTSRKKKYS